MQETKQILKKVKKVEIKTKKLVDGLLQGAYHSIFKGRGIEFSEVREYIPGDDIRIIDWNVTSRMNKPYVKEFIEERDLTVYILFDVSGSNEFGSVKSKKEAAIELGASIMFAALKNDDKIGLCLFTKHVEKFIKAKKSKKHVLKLIRDLVNFNPEFKTTDLNETLKFISKVVKKRSIIFIISDFFSDDFSRPLSIMKNRHDVIAINLNDIREQEIPDVGYIELEDEETDEQVLVNTSDISFREKYMELINKKNNDLRVLLSKLKIDMIQIKSDEPFEVPLTRFFRVRERRMIR
jgi:uncharacterized protein (DUF58 family)